MRRTYLAFLPLVALSFGCTSVEPYEQEIQRLTWKLDAAEHAAEQLAVDRELAHKETELVQNDNGVLREKLALAYDAVREARSQVDEGLHDRITELAETTDTPGTTYEISQYGGVVLENGIFFGSGRFELSDAGQSALDQLAAKLMSSDYAEYEFEIAGHTDSDPIRRTADRFRDNFDLGAMRANSVRRHLSERGIEDTRVSVSSWGPERPLDASDKSRNRRVEIVLHTIAGDEEQATTVPASAPREE